MSSVTQPVTSWDEFLLLPERPENAKRYELHDGEVVVVSLPRPWHLKRQTQIHRLLLPLAGERGIIACEFPYRPAPNLQYWVVDLAFVPQADWDTMPLEQWQVYAPPLIIEILSPSNTAVKINRQRMTAMSAGTLRRSGSSMRRSRRSRSAASTESRCMAAARRSRCRCSMGN